MIIAICFIPRHVARQRRAGDGAYGLAAQKSGDFQPVIAFTMARRTLLGLTDGGVRLRYRLFSCFRRGGAAECAGHAAEQAARIGVLHRVGRGTRRFAEQIGMFGCRWRRRGCWGRCRLAGLLCSSGNLTGNHVRRGGGMAGLRRIGLLL